MICYLQPVLGGMSRSCIHIEDIILPSYYQGCSILDVARPKSSLFYSLQLCVNPNLRIPVYHAACNHTTPFSVTEYELSAVKR
jgi:hypothetical protein